MQQDGLARTVYRVLRLAQFISTKVPGMSLSAKTPVDKLATSLSGMTSDSVATT